VLFLFWQKHSEGFPCQLSLKLPEKILPILQQYQVDKINNTDFIFTEMKKANANLIKS